MVDLSFSERSGGNIGCFEILAILRTSPVTSIDAAEIIPSLRNFVDKCGRRTHLRFVLWAYPRFGFFHKLLTRRMISCARMQRSSGVGMAVDFTSVYRSKSDHTSIDFVNFLDI
jgi:hypothetical protein